MLSEGDKVIPGKTKAIIPNQIKGKEGKVTAIIFHEPTYLVRFPNFGLEFEFREDELRHRQKEVKYYGSYR